MSQLFINFNVPEGTNVPSDDEQSILKRFAQRFGIQHLLRTELLHFKARQFLLMHEVCSRYSVNMLLEGGTGLGKTLIFLCRALISIAKGKSVVLVVPQQTLGDQCKKKALTQTHLTAQDILVVSGDMPPEKRILELRTKRKLYISTAGAMLTDFESYPWDDIDFIMFDETQYVVGDSNGMQLANHLEKHIRYNDLKVTVSGMSATLASSKANLRVLKLALNTQSIVTVRTPSDDAESAKDIVKLEQVELDSLSRSILHTLRVSACTIFNEIQESLGAPMLFPVPKETEYWLPQFKDRNQLRQKLLDPEFVHKDAGVLRGKLIEMEYYIDLHFRLHSLGYFSFLERYTYNWVQSLFSRRKGSPRLYLQEVSSDQSQKSKRKGILSGGKKRVFKNKKLRQMVRSAAETTPYAIALSSQTWAELKEKLHTLPVEPEFEDRPCASSRQNIAERRNVYLARTSKSRGLAEYSDDIALCRNYFSMSLGEMARRTCNEHQKELHLLEILNAMRRQLSSISSFIFTPYTRHAEFLAERLEHLCMGSSLNPIFAHGGAGAGMDAHRIHALEGFNQGLYKTLVTTVAFAGTGIDVENATLGIHWALQNSNPIALLQANGRVLGRAEDPLLYLLWSKGSQSSELKRLLSAVEKELKRRRMILKHAKVLDEQYDMPKY